MPRRLLCAALLALWASGCRTVEFGTTATPTPVDSSGTADITLTNRLETDPGPLTFLVFGADAQAVDDAQPVATLGKVGTNETITAKIASGKWKIAFENEVQVRHAMPADSIGGNPEWHAVEIAKGGSYTLTIETDEGGVTVWVSDLPDVSP